MKFTDKATGNILFLPAVGNRSSVDGMLLSAGSRGVYWSSSSHKRFDVNACYFFFNNGDVRWEDGYRWVARSVRCVAE